MPKDVMRIPPLTKPIPVIASSERVVAAGYHTSVRSGLKGDPDVAFGVTRTGAKRA